MKTVVAISIDESLAHRIAAAAQDGKYRNKSHLVEEAIKRFLEETDG